VSDDVELEGGISLVATPIGNLGDLSPRSIEALTSADLWLVEDTRVSARLATKLEVRKPMKLLTDQTEDSQLFKYIQLAKSGTKIAVITDGGSPGISDPGSRLCDLSHEAEISLDAIPGPSAVTMALTLSGFYGQRFAFLGFLGRKPGAIKSEIEGFASSPLTLVIFENPRRIEMLIENAFSCLGERRYAICRELTKVHQQVWRGTLAELPSEEVCPRLGEFTVVIEGKRSSRQKI